MKAVATDVNPEKMSNGINKVPGKNNKGSYNRYQPREVVEGHEQSA